MRGDTLYNTFEFWKGGKVVAEYKKQALHFLDHTPQWLDFFGLYTAQFAYRAGEERGPTEVDGVPVGALICSELVQNGIVSAQADGALLLLSIGSEAMFIDDTIGLFSLRAAQFRAVEHNLPLVRADALGPSALVDRTGRVLAYAPWGESATLTGVVPLTLPRQTLYARFGHTPLYLLWGAVLIAALYFKRQIKFLQRKGQE